MRYYDLIPRDNLVKNSLVADEWNISARLVELLQDGQPVSRWPADAAFWASSAEMDGDLDDFVVNNALAPIVTPRLRACICEMRTPKIEWLPVVIRSSRGVQSECFVMNFKEFVRGLDLARTRVFRYPRNHRDPALRNRIQTMMNTTLIKDRVKDWDLFRLEEFPPRLFGSERFKKAFTGNRFTGVSFARVKLS